MLYQDAVLRYVEYGAITANVVLKADSCTAQASFPGH